MSFTIRFATKEDVSTILQFIIALAKYEQLEHEVVATEDLLTKTLFGARPQAETLLYFENDTAVGFALFSPIIRPFLDEQVFISKICLYSNLFRGRGYGKALLDKMQAIAQERQAGRLEWNVLDWNTPAIQFYESMGAKPVSGWTTYRMTF